MGKGKFKAVQPLYIADPEIIKESWEVSNWILYILRAYPFRIT